MAKKAKRNFTLEEMYIKEKADGPKFVSLKGYLSKLHSFCILFIPYTFT